TFSGNEMIISLTGIANRQVVTLTANNVTGQNGGSIGAVSVNIGFLLGDVTGNLSVSNTDVGAVKAQVNPTAPITASNFRDDVSVNGFVTNTDVGTTKAQV